MTLNFQDDIQQIIMLKAILKTGVIVGTLDALAAIIILYLKSVCLILYPNFQCIHLLRLIRGNI